MWLKYILFKVYSDRYGCLWAKPRISTHPRTPPDIEYVALNASELLLPEKRVEVSRAPAPALAVLAF